MWINKIQAWCVIGFIWFIVLPAIAFILVVMESKKYEKPLDDADDLGYIDQARGSD